MTHPVRRLARQLREDATSGVLHTVFNSVGGSFLVPRAARWALFRAAGAHLASPPGPRFTLAGSAENLTVGRDVYFNQRVFVEAVAPVSIGDGTSLGMEALVVTSSHPVDASGTWQRGAEGLPVAIGARCWIGARAVVLPGVTIADDVVVAAAAVVTRDCLEPGVYAGVPARLIRAFPPRDAAGRTAPEQSPR